MLKIVIIISFSLLNGYNTNFLFYLCTKSNASQYPKLDAKTNANPNAKLRKISQTTKVMTKINTLETPYENFLRTRAEEVCQLYLGWSHEILSGQVKPNRVIQNIAQTKGMSGEGVKSILKRRGVYKSAQQPVVSQCTESIPFTMYNKEQPKVTRL